MIITLKSVAMTLVPLLLLPRLVIQGKNGPKLRVVFQKRYIKHTYIESHFVKYGRSKEEVTQERYHFIFLDQCYV